MDHERDQSLVLRATERSRKDYSFDDDHDPTEPVDVFFQESDEGTVLFVVLYTMACRYSRCTFCPLPATSTINYIGYRPLMDQIDRIFERPDVIERAPSVDKIILSNQGSVLDEHTFSSLALLYFVAKALRVMPDLDIMCMETRPEYVDDDELEFLARAMSEGHETTLEIGIGFEAFDDTLRNGILKKGLVLSADSPHGFENLVRRVAKHNFWLKCYFMLKPDASLTDEAAIADVHNVIDYLSDVSAQHGAHISLHLNPTFAGIGTPLSDAFEEGEFTPPTLRHVAQAALHGEHKGIPIFLGLNDEGLAVPGGSFIRPGEEATVAELERFNRTGDYEILHSLLVDA